MTISEHLRANLTRLCVYALAKAAHNHRFYINNRPLMNPKDFKEFQAGARASLAYIAQLEKFSQQIGLEETTGDDAVLGALIESARLESEDYIRRNEE